MKSREAIATLALTLKGKNEKDGSFKSIIDGYNSHSPIPRNYKVKYTDNWCATFISYLAIALGYADIIPIECSCGRLVELAKQMGIWDEDDAYTPNIGDIIMYDWQDSGVGDDTGWPDHVGIVVKVTDKTIYVIEGNKSEAVGERRILVNAKNIRGYITPHYDSAIEVDPVPQIVAPAQPVNPDPVNPTSQPVTQPQNVPSFVVRDTYKLKYELKVREGAGTNFRAKSHAELTSDGQNHDDDGDGALNAGTIVTCKETMQNGNDIWMRTPSGWIAAYYNGEMYVDGVANPAPQATPAPAYPSWIGTVNTPKGLNVRSGPGANNGKLYALICGTRVIVNGESNGWYNVHIDGRPDGWCAKEYISN